MEKIAKRGQISPGAQHSYFHHLCSSPEAPTALANIPSSRIGPAVNTEHALTWYLPCTESTYVVRSRPAVHVMEMTSTTPRRRHSTQTGNMAATASASTAAAAAAAASGGVRLTVHDHRTNQSMTNAQRSSTASSSRHRHKNGTAASPCLTSPWGRPNVRPSVRIGSRAVQSVRSNQRELETAKALFFSSTIRQFYKNEVNLNEKSKFHFLHQYFSRKVYLFIYNK